jgi:heme/copper-type cytochrome/quinol oxidase subunit 2
MKIFNSEVHDTAIVFICLNVLGCLIYSFIVGQEIGRHETLVIVWFAVVFSVMYWLANYSAYHFKNNNNENED